MRRVLSLGVVAVVALSASVHAQRPLKVYISADMEGITGVASADQLGPASFEYSQARQWMTAEVLAAMQGAREAGATEFVISDSHGNGQSVLIDQLPEDVRIVRGFPRPLEMMQGIDDTFAAAVFIGYHASEWTANAVRGHTISSARLLGVNRSRIYRRFPQAAADVDERSHLRAFSRQLSVFSSQLSVVTRPRRRCFLWRSAP